MNKGLHNGTVAGTLGAMLCACALAACTTQEADGTGGSGGSTLPANGGAGGSGTTTSAAGGLGTLCPLPQQLITDFTAVLTDAGTAPTDLRFGAGQGTLQGGGSVYPTTLKADFSQGTWHISGTVDNYAGFGLYFDNCDRIDASAFKGLSFTLSGTVPGGAITVGAGTVNNTPTGTWMSTTGGDTTAKATDAGKCTPTSGTQYYHPGCTDPTAQVTVTATPTPQSIPWATLTGGAPDASVTPSELTSIYWILPWTEGRAPYEVDIVIDNLGFIP